MKLFSLFFAIFYCCAAFPAHANQVSDVPKMTVLIADGQRPTYVEAMRERGYSIDVHAIDTPAKIVKFINADLPRDEAAAIAQVRKRMQSIPPSTLQSIWHGPVLRVRWDLKQLPAIVFGDGDAVIYGVLDMRRAITIWEKQQ